MALQNKIVEALDKAQSSVVYHPKLLKSLKTLHDKTEAVVFFEAFIQPLCAALVVYKREPVVERVLDFVAKFAASVAPLAPAQPEEEEEWIGKAALLSRYHPPPRVECLIPWLLCRGQ